MNYPSLMNLGNFCKYCDSITMCELLCRICGKINKENNPINLFGNQNKELLLKIKDLTGIRLKNNLTLPKSMCCICKKNLEDAHKFREDFLKVQASFRIKGLKGNKKLTHNGLIEATEFVQVFIVKEENNITIDNNEDIHGEDEEKEISILDSEDLNKTQNPSKECSEEVNALELKPNEENTLEDTKITIEEVTCDKKDIAFGTSKDVSDDEDLDNKYSDEEYKSETEILDDKKLKWTREKKKSDYLPSERENNEVKRKITKARKKRKDYEDNPNIFICDQCGNHFTCRHHFKLHLRRHSGDKRCACELCPDKFFTSSELRRHMRRHTGERPFACKYCERRFTDYSTRIKHERTHTNERPFMCSQCGKSFTTSYILKNHMLTHTGERHFKCDVCNRAFTRRTHLVVHFRSIMHKQAVEKEKLPISIEELPKPHCLIEQSTHIPTFIV